MTEFPRSSEPFLDAETVRRLFGRERLRVARELRGLSQVDVARAAGVSSAAINQFEHGEATPSAGTLSLLAEVLGVPLGFFAISPGDRELALPAFFRSLRSAPASDRRRARALALLVRWLALTLEHWVRLPDLSIPRIRLGRGAAQSDVEDVAADLRRRWDLKPGPVDHAVRLLERHGVVMTRFEVTSEKLDAFSIPFPDRPVVVLSDDKGDKARSRFDALHELGHLVMHEPDEQDDKVVEQQAHWFAASFLMPAPEIVKALPPALDLRRLIALKGEWGASIAALLRRAKDLQVMDEPSYVSAMKELSVRGWRRREPGDLGPPEMPALLQHAVELVQTQGITLSHLAQEARLPLDDVSYVLRTSKDSRPSLSL